MTDPYEPPKTQPRTGEMSTLHKSALCVAVGTGIWAVAWMTTQNPSVARFVLWMIGAIPTVQGVVYGMANVLFGQEEF